MESPSPANSSIASKRSYTSVAVSPAVNPPSRMFSRPVSSRLKPTPRDSNGVTRPHTATRPAVGGRMPAIVRSSVVFPAPLRPMTP